MRFSQTLSWTSATSYYITWVNNGNAEPPQPPGDAASVPSNPISPLPTLPAAQAESDA